MHGTIQVEKTIHCILPFEGAQLIQRGCEPQQGCSYQSTPSRPHWPKPRIQCVILSFYTATTMDQSLLRLIPHLAEARGGQGPLVADAFNTACPKNNNQALVSGAWGAVNETPPELSVTQSLWVSFMTYSVAKCLVIDIVYWQRNYVKSLTFNWGHIKCLGT